MVRWCASGTRLRANSFCAQLALAGAAALAICSPSGAGPAERPTRGSLVTSADTVESVRIIVDKSKTFTLSRPFSTATVGNGEIAEALPMSDRVLYVQGKKLGTTNVSIFDSSAHLISVIDIDVVPEVLPEVIFQQKLRNLQHAIGANIGNRGIRVASAGGQVVLSGVAPDAVAAERAVSVAKTLVPDGNVVNAMTIASPQQVMLKVRFLEVNRQAGRELGVNWFVANKNGTRGAQSGLCDPVQGCPGQTQPQGRPGIPSVDTTGNPVTGTGLPIFQGLGTLLAGAGGASAAPFGVALANLVNKGTSIDLMISALETKGLVRSLAEPDLVALSGDVAAFLAGGEFPVSTLQSGGSNSFPVVTVDYKPFGVQLTFTPTVLANGKINLRLAPSVSEIASFVQTPAGPVPVLSKREARTTIELRDGQSFAIAGLLQSHTRRDVAQLPWIGSVPVLGTLFSSKSFQEDETDLVVIVTPHAVAPAAPGQQIASPLDSRLPSNDVDFFLNGQMELRKEYQDFVSKGEGLQGPYGYMLRPEVGVPPPLPRPVPVPAISVKN